MWWAFDDICEFLIVHSMPFMPWNTPKLHTKCQIWHTLSWWEMGWCATRGGSYCCWSVSQASLDVWGRGDKLLTAYTSSYCWHHVISIEFNSLIAHKIVPDSWYPPCMGNMAIYCEKRYVLLMKCFIPFLTCISKIWGTFESIYAPLIVHIVTFTLMPTLKLHTQYKISGTLFTREIECYDTRRGIHYWWSGP